MNVDYHLDAEKQDILNDFDADAFNSVLIPEKKLFFYSIFDKLFDMKIL